MRLAVAGGTGTVGRLLVAAARRDGHDTTVLSRSAGVDLLAPDSVGQALTGVDVVVDVTNRSTIRRRAAVSFFDTVTRALLSAETRAGVTHHIALSVVGIESEVLPYHAGKLHQEQLIMDGTTPWTVLRSTQFHEFATQLLPTGHAPVAVIPALRIQPVAAREVAEHLLHIALSAPAERAPDLAGPEEHQLPDLARRTLQALGRRTTVIPLAMPGRRGRLNHRGALLPQPGATRGSQTFQQWLDNHPARQP